jgi:putative SOS response-associated peptidase YedK
MCNHYQTHPEDIPDWGEWAGFSVTREKLPMTADIWPKRAGLVARIDVEAKRIIEPMIWGVPLTIPGKRPGTTLTKRVTNVRNLTSPFWRSMLTKPIQRCLVPFSRFAEPKPNAGREEVWFNLPAEPIGAFAGIWRECEEGRVFAFLTTVPNPLVAQFHPKAMPVILHRDQYNQWLTADWAEAAALAEPFPSQLMAIVDSRLDRL